MSEEDLLKLAPMERHDLTCSDVNMTRRLAMHGQSHLCCTSCKSQIQPVGRSFET